MNESDYLFSMEGFKKTDIQHWGIKGQKWGVRRYQNPDGSLTPAGKQRYSNPDGSLNKKGQKKLDAKLYERHREYEAETARKTQAMTNKQKELSKTIPGVKLRGTTLAVEKGDTLLEMENDSVSNGKFKEMYQNLGQHKKSMMSDMVKDLMSQADEDDIEDYREMTKNPTDFRIRMIDDKLAEVSYYSMNPVWAADVYADFDISKKKPQLVGSVSVDT